MASEEKKSTYEEAKRDTQSAKPPIGTPTSGGMLGTGMVLPSGASGAAKVVTGDPSESVKASTVTVDPNKARVGDYTISSTGNLTVVPGSLTDVKQKYQALYGANKTAGWTLSEVASAIASGYAMSKGVTSTVGAAMGPLAVAVGAIQAGSSLKEAYDQKVADFLSQPVSSQYAFDIVYDDDGTRKAVLDPKVAAAAGYGSGEGIRDIMNTEGTSVSLNNGGLDIKVSSGFASSEEYAKLLNDLSEYLPDGITEEMANQKDDETGSTLLEYLNKYVQDSENSYYYKAQSVKSFKEIAPAASAQSLEEACNTQLVGGMKNKELENFDIVIYDSDNQKQEVNALEYVKTVADMDPRERNDYMLEIGNRIASDEISDDEKVILQAQANALYMVSNNKESGFKGIYEKDFLDSVADARSLFFGVRLGNLFGIRPEKAAFEDNDKAQGVIILLGSVARAKTMSKMTDKIEGLLRGATTRIGQKLGVDVVKEFAQRKGFVSDVTQEAMEKAAGAGAKEVAKIAGKAALNRASNLSYQLASDAIYEGARALAFAATGESFDYWDELKDDFITDIVITYGPASFVDAMEMDGYEYRRIGDEVKLVKKTADEVASRRAKVLDRLSDSKIILKTQELFSDQNAAMGKLATQIRATVNDVTAYMRTLRYGNNIRQLTADEYSRFRTSSPEVEKHYTEYEKNLAEVAPNSRDLTDADIRYINASANKYRFSQEFKGKRGEIRKVNAKYKEAIEGVSKERAKQLDKLMMSMRAVYADLFNYYREKGLISQEEYDRITNSPAYAGGMYFPVWKKDRKFEEGSLIIPQTRNVKKEVIDPKDLIDVDEFDNPLTTFSRYSVAVMRNIAANERKLAMRDAGIIAGMRTRVVKDTGGSLKETEKLKQYNKDFKRIYDNIVKEVEKEVPTEEEHRKANMDAINRSKASKTVESIKGLQEEAHALQNKLARQRRALKKAQNLESQKDLSDTERRGASEDVQKLTEDIDQTRFEIAQNKQKQVDALNELPRLTKLLMQRMSDSNKHSPLKLDIDSYINVNFANDIKEALKQNNSYGAMQIAINRAVDVANPYVSRESIIQERAGKSAERFRKRVSKDFPKDKEGRVDSIVDKIADKFGIKRNTYRRTGNSVTYMLNGKEERMVFEGPGAEMLVKELEAPDFVAPANAWEAVIDKKRKIGAGFSRLKRFTTTTADVARIAPNLIRDYMRGIITTGGQILLSPDTLRSEIIENGNYTPEQIEIINRGFNLAREAISRSTFTQSLETPKKNRPKAMINAAHAETAGNAFEKYYWEFKGKSWMERASILSDMAEEFTRKRAMDVEYYRTLQRATAEGKDIDTAVKEATEAAYFAGREATTNFGRRGSYIGKLAEQTAYLSSKFATLESFKYAYLKDPIAVTRSLRTLVGSYAFMIAIALSNDESRKRYYMLTEAERASSIIVPLDNGLIVRLPLDETIAAFLTPYRRMIETLNGVDPEAFYLWGAEFLAALSPLDFTGFSEGNKFNVMRGMQKLTNDVAATWALPILENMQGYDFYYGTKIKVDADYTDTYYGISNPTPAEMTTKNKNSQILGFVANALGMPQWKLQNYVESYGGNVGQYLLNIGDKLVGATEEAQGGKEFFDSIFKPFTGSETSAAQSALWDGIEQLNNEKEKLRNEIKDIDREIAAATGDEKAQLQEKRQNKIRDYGLRVSTFLDQYLSAYEITGGLSKSEASRIWYLYDIYGETDNTDVYADDSIEDYYNSKLNKQRNKRATNLAALSNFGKYVNTALGNYYSVYGEQAFKNSLYGQGTQTMAKIAGALEDTADYDNSFTKLKSDAYDARSKAYDAGDYDLADAIAYEYDLKVLKAALPYLQEAGLEQSLNNSTVMDYLKDWVMVPSSEMVTAKGRYLSKLPSETEKSEAYKKRFIKKMYGVLKDE